MLSESKIKKMADLGFVNKDFEKMKQQEKDIINKKLNEDEIQNIKNELKQEIVVMNKLKGYITNSYKNKDNLYQMTKVEFYKINSFLYLNIYTIKNFFRVKEYKKYYASQLYSYYYKEQKTTINTFKRILAINFIIMDSKKGYSDSDFKLKDKRVFLENTLHNIYTKQNNLQYSVLRERLCKSLEEIMDPSNKDEYIKDIFEKLVYNGFNYIDNDNHNKSYKFLEQFILAPLYIFEIKQSYKSLKSKKYNLKKDLKCIDFNGIEEIDIDLLHKEEFTRIRDDQVLAYCCTVFMELYNCHFHDLKKVYAYFYSESILLYNHNNKNTQFLKEPYKHVHNYKNRVFEFLPFPFTKKEYEKVFYDISIDNFPREDVEFHQNELTIDSILSRFQA